MFVGFGSRIHMSLIGAALDVLFVTANCNGWHELYVYVFINSH
jgi:hypothetical protein